MLRSMYAGISGMKNFQTKLDVIGNNIANVNTYGFKKGRVIFKDLINQNIQGASGPGQSRGGTNAKQVGLGSQLAAIDTIHTGGATQTTNRILDVAIAGDGFFQVTTNPTQTGAYTNQTSPSYTRAGNFYLDKDGYLVNSDGLYIVGFASYQKVDHDNDATTPDIDQSPKLDDYKGVTYDFSAKPPKATGTISSDSKTYNVEYKPIKIPSNAKDMSIGKDGTISYVDDQGTLRWAGQLVLAKFPNNDGLQKTGSNLFQATANSGTATLNFSGQGGLGTTEAGFLEMSNVDLSEEFTEMIVAQRGFQSNTKIITTSDEILQELVNLKR